MPPLFQARAMQFSRLELLGNWPHGVAPAPGGGESLKDEFSQIVEVVRHNLRPAVVCALRSHLLWVISFF